MGRKKCVPVVVAGKVFPKELTAALDAFLEHMAGSDYSPKSIYKRKGCVLRLIDFLHRNQVKRWQDVEPAIIDAYRSEILAQDYSQHTIYSFFQSLRIFFNYLEEKAILFDNPIRGMTVAKPKPKLGLVLTETEIRELLAIPDLTTPYGVRDRAIIEVLYGTGIRLGECVGLTIYDVDVDNHTITVIGKRDKQRLIPTGKHAAKYLKIYLREARKKLIRDNLPPEELWIGKMGGRPLGDAAIRLMIKRHAAAAGLSDETDTHCLRRTCATHLLRGGAHPVAVAQLLGHSELSSLAHYLKTTLTDLIKTHSNSKPGQ